MKNIYLQNVHYLQNNLFNFILQMPSNKIMSFLTFYNSINIRKSMLNIRY